MNEDLTVALIDDEPELRDALRILLESRGYVTHAFGCPLDALRELVPNPPDVVVTDLRMDAMTGTELAQRLRAVHPHVGVVVVTGYASLDAAVDALRAGCSDFLEKPVRGAELFAAIERAAAQGSQNSRPSHDPLVAVHRVHTHDEAFLLDAARFLAAELARLGLSGPYRRRLIDAVFEAVENVQRHAYGPDGGICTLQVTHGDRSTIVVKDDGSGFEPASEEGILHSGPTQGLLRALANVTGARIHSQFGRGTRIEFPLDREELSLGERFARWSTGQPMQEEASASIEDPPWWTKHVEPVDGVPGKAADATERTVRDVLWL
ncbi:MAG: response regulator [Planctomycetes bacterium]|nr:response regulator [Planctomycetota bacterium]